MKAVGRTHILTVIGWLLTVPFGVVLANEVRLAVLVIFTDHNADDMGSIELAIGGILLAITAPIALGGWALIRNARADAVTRDSEHPGKLLAIAAAVLASVVIVFMFVP